MKKPLIVIAGPTACGKTKISIELAKKTGGEIISADSMQVYKYMDIGTAKVTKKEMDDIPHYMIDELYPDEKFNVVVFKEKAVSYINDIYLRNKLPIIAGGTGFYINALVNDNIFMSTNENEELRKNLYSEAELFGVEYLHNKLKKIDPDAAASIHPNNIKRVARAIEFYILTNQRISEHNKIEKNRVSPYNTALFVLNMERGELYKRIDLRVDIMIENGLLKEVENLINMGYDKNLVSMQGLGYKEFIPVLNGEKNLEDAVYELKKSTRHFAKRQLTWFKAQKNAIWVNDVDKRDIDDILNEILNHCGRIFNGAIL
ncbi:MAG: tRNA (adenosine(37)-N6)-dimethylallyltransferase MiaA [Lachnospiraceae bacterium]|nr:tRNA (adenosine(37)-N6)-dimethylallyltransferase MiaA [Lachnospiraceae bacterium]